MLRVFERQIDDFPKEKFGYTCYHKEVAVAHVDVVGEHATCTYLAPDNNCGALLGKTKGTREDVRTFFESRCFDADNRAADELLESLELDEYDPFKIVAIMHGVLAFDTYWIKLDGEELDWEKDVKPFYVELGLVEE